MLDRSLKYMLGYGPEDSDLAVVNTLSTRLLLFGKPCHELAHCPYGELALDQPPLSLAFGNKPSDEEVLEIDACLADGRWAPHQVEHMEDYVRGRLEQMEAPAMEEEAPDFIEDAICSLTGRACPALLEACDWSEDDDEPGRFTVETCDCCVRAEVPRDAARTVAAHCPGRRALPRAAACRRQRERGLAHRADCWRDMHVNAGRHRFLRRRLRPCRKRQLVRVAHGTSAGLQHAYSPRDEQRPVPS